MKRKLNLVPLALMLMFFASCECARKERVPLDEIDVTIELRRFDKDLFSINTNSIDYEIVRISQEYPIFFPLFAEGVIGIGTPEDENFSTYLTSFIEDRMVSETYKQVQQVFPNTTELNNELTNAFKRYRYYFPDKQIPAVYGFVSGFNNSVVLADSVLAVGFDRYLGRDCEYYSQLGIYKYLQYNMHPQKIPSDLVRAWIFSEYQFNDSIDNLVNNMIYEGSLMYVTKRLLHNHPDSLIFGFTPEQMKWCRNNESHMWAYLVEHKMLFTTDNFIINQFVSGAPFTKGFPPESPGKAAVWLGYRIVTRFMDRNKDYTLEMLLNEKDYQSILSRARYNP
ncbi:MAG TPA: hypothetical protein ENN24_00765 [Bacteroidetes bacterium]|nr:hypothetical protein [Bacteroidota bacterium]